DYFSLRRRVLLAFELQRLVLGLQLMLGHVDRRLSLDDPPIGAFQLKLRCRQLPLGFFELLPNLCEFLPNLFASRRGCAVVQGDLQTVSLLLQSTVVVDELRGQVEQLRHPKQSPAGWFHHIVT
ncbi:MAG TPA: hypothetical protein PLV92_23445, partial [Pirellulaceae bacterium]|nr:hypothetical protein [Pirellulaceae bacterium]